MNPSLQTRNILFMAQMRLFSTSVLLILLLLLGLAGCSGDGEREAVDGVKACTLVSQTEMEEISGRKMQAPVEKTHGQGAASTCAWNSEDATGKDAGAPMKSFALLVSAFGESDAKGAYDSYVASLKKTANIDVTEIEDIGEKACWSEEVGQLTVFSRGHTLLLTAGPKEQGQLDICRRIMAKALSRLPN